MSMVRIHEEQRVPFELIDLSVENPNEQSDDEFSALVEEIIEHGWTDRVVLIGPFEDGRYKMTSGEHRYKAALVLEMEELPAVVVPPDEWDDDVRKVQLVKQNVLRGRLNPVKFTELFNDLAARYDVETTQRMMGFTKQDAFDRLYEDAKKALPPGMAEKLEGVRGELKTIDDLSLVLNRLFTEYGDTLMFHAMFFAWGGREHVMVQLEAPGAWQRVKRFVQWCVDEKVAVDEALMERMDWPV